jgi:hypothetical protein
MGLNTTKTDAILKRREEVSRYRLRGWTQRQIAEILVCSLGTVNHDLKALEAEWREAAQATVEQHKQRILAELAEVKRAAWADKSYGAVMQAIKAEVDLLGLDAPVKVEHSGEVTVSDARAELERRYNQLATAAGTGEAFRQPN